MTASPGTERDRTRNTEDSIAKRLQGGKSQYQVPKYSGASRSRGGKGPTLPFRIMPSVEEALEKGEASADELREARIRVAGLQQKEAAMRAELQAAQRELAAMRQKMLLQMGSAATATASPPAVDSPADVIASADTSSGAAPARPTPAPATEAGAAGGEASAPHAFVPATPGTVWAGMACKTCGVKKKAHD